MALDPQDQADIEAATNTGAMGGLGGAAGGMGGMASGGVMGGASTSGMAQASAAMNQAAQSPQSVGAGLSAGPVGAPSASPGVQAGLSSPGIGGVVNSSGTSTGWGGQSPLAGRTGTFGGFQGNQVGAAGQFGPPGGGIGFQGPQTGAAGSVSPGGGVYGGVQSGVNFGTDVAGGYNPLGVGNWADYGVDEGSGFGEFMGVDINPGIAPNTQIGGLGRWGGGISVPSLRGAQGEIAQQGTAAIPGDWSNPIPQSKVEPFETIPFGYNFPRTYAPVAFQSEPALPSTGSATGPGGMFGGYDLPSQPGPGAGFGSPQVRATPQETIGAGGLRGPLGPQGQPRTSHAEGLARSYAASQAGLNDPAYAQSLVDAATKTRSLAGLMPGTGLTAEQQRFVDTLTGPALHSAAITGEDPRITAGQALKESVKGKGISGLARNYNNPFGTKSPSGRQYQGIPTWEGQTTGPLGTKEFEQGKEVSTTGIFNAYPTANQAVWDRTRKLMEQPAYQNVLSPSNTTLAAQATALDVSPWATDIKGYGESVLEHAQRFAQPQGTIAAPSVNPTQQTTSLAGQPSTSATGPGPYFANQPSLAPAPTQQPISPVFSDYTTPPTSQPQDLIRLGQTVLEQSRPKPSASLPSFSDYTTPSTSQPPAPPSFSDYTTPPTSQPPAPPAFSDYTTAETSQPPESQLMREARARLAASQQTLGAGLSAPAYGQQQFSESPEVAAARQRMQVPDLSVQGAPPPTGTGIQRPAFSEYTTPPTSQPIPSVPPAPGATYGETIMGQPAPMENYGLPGMNTIMGQPAPMENLDMRKTQSNLARKTNFGMPDMFNTGAAPFSSVFQPSGMPAPMGNYRMPQVPAIQPRPGAEPFGSAFMPSGMPAPMGNYALPQVPASAAPTVPQQPAVTAPPKSAEEPPWAGGRTGTVRPGQNLNVYEGGARGSALENYIRQGGAQDLVFPPPMPPSLLSSPPRKKPKSKAKAKDKDEDDDKKKKKRPRRLFDLPPGLL